MIRATLFRILILTSMISLISINSVLFSKLFGISYIKWFIENGATIGIVSTFLSMSWGKLDGHIDLISLDPARYFAACFQIIGLPILAMGIATAPKKTRRDLLVVNLSYLFDACISTILIFAIAIIAIAWIFTIAPFQYFVFMIAGAPARSFLLSDKRLIARFNGAHLQTLVVGEDKSPITEPWWDASLSRKPFAVTNIFSTILFLAASYYS